MYVYSICQCGHIQSIFLSTYVAYCLQANANKVMDEVGVLSERLNMNNPLTLEHKSDVVSILLNMNLLDFCFISLYLL